MLLGRTATLFAWLVLTGCASTAPPRQSGDLCALFAERPSWRAAAERASERWDLDIATAMAFVRYESSFRADARPPRTRLLGILPWTRPSSAYGYAQATDATWEDYQRATGRRWFVSRDDFADAIDFVGWFNARTRRELGIAASDVVALYLAYHEGLTGYRQGSWRSNTSLQRYAAQVAAQAVRYGADLQRCR